MSERPLTLFHAPHTRSSAVLALLEELGAPYTLNVLDRSKEENRSPAFLAINPLGKVPALLDGSAVVTEQVAIFLHLADLFPAAGLAPAVQDQLRGPYLRWMAFYAAAFEPALVDKARGHEPGMRAISPYGSYQEVIDTVMDGLQPGPFLLGSTFSRRRRVVGRRAGLDHAFQAGAGTPCDPRLYRPGRRPPGVATRSRQGRRIGSRAGASSLGPSDPLERRG